MNANPTDSVICKPNTSHLATCLYGILLFLFFSYLGYSGWPGLHWDSCLYGPTILNVARNGEWIPGVYPYGIKGEFSSVHTHGFLSVVLFGDLLECKNWQTLLTRLGLFNGATAVAWFFISRIWRQSHTQLAQFESFLLGSVAGILSTNLQGRPEHPVVLLSILPLVFARLFGEKVLAYFAIPLTSALIFISSPQTGALSTLFIFVYFASQPRYSAKTFIFQVATCGTIAAIFVFLLAKAFYPVPFVRWIRDLIGYSKGALDFSDHIFRLDFDSLMGISTLSPFWNVFVLFGWSFALSRLIQMRKLIPCIPFLFVSLYLWPKLTDYGFIASFPFLLLYFRVVADSLSPLKSILAKSLNASWWIFSLAYLLVLVQFYTESNLASLSKVTMHDSNSDFNRIMQRNLVPPPKLGDIGFCWHPGYSYVVLTDASQRYFSVSADRPNASWSATTNAFLDRYPQSGRFILFPLEVTGDQNTISLSNRTYELVYRSSHSQRLPFYLKSRQIGYPFAIYRCVEVDE